MSVAMIEARSSRRHLPEPRLHAEKGAGRRRPCAARDRTGQDPPHRRRQAEPRLGGADRPREGDDQGHSRRNLARSWPSAVSRYTGPCGLHRAERRCASAIAGSRPGTSSSPPDRSRAPLPIPGAEHMITSDEMLSERDAARASVFRRRRRHRARIRPRLRPRRRESHDPRSASPTAAGNGRRCRRAGSGRKRADRDQGQDRRQGQAHRAVPWTPACDLRHVAPSTRSRPTGSSTARDASPMSIRSISTPARVERRRPHRARRSPALHIQSRRLRLRRRVVARRSSRRSPPMRAQIVGRNIVEGPKHSPTTPAFRPASTRCRRWPASD